MNLDHTTVLVSAVLFIATLIRSAFGFGEALVAVPVLALLLPVEVAAAVAVLVSVTVALIVVVQDWRHIHLESARNLVLPTFLGIPLGLLLLKTAPEGAVKILLGFVIVNFSGHSLFGKWRLELPTDRFAWIFGFTAGILGGAYGMNGPPLAIYGSLRRWSPQHFRATLQGYFLPASLVGLSGYWLAGLWTQSVSRFFLISLPPVIAATFLGRAINRRITGQRFLIYVHAGLLAVGIVLLLQAILGKAPGAK